MEIAFAYYAPERRAAHAGMAIAGVAASCLAGARTVPSHWLEICKMIDWIPVVFVIFKLSMFSTCMFFAIKWHYDQGKKGGNPRAVLRAGGKVAAIFLAALLLLGLLTFTLVRTMGLDLTFS
jgi:hypothetical protein